MFVMALMSLHANAQDPLVFEQVVTKEGKNAEEIYNLIKRWVAITYNSAKDVIQLDNPNKEITLKAKIDYKESSMTWAAASSL